MKFANMESLPYNLVNPILNIKMHKVSISKLQLNLFLKYGNHFYIVIVSGISTTMQYIDI